MRTREGLQSAGSRVGDPVSASKTVVGGFSPPGVPPNESSFYFPGFSKFSWN